MERTPNPAGVILPSLGTNMFTYSVGQVAFGPGV